MTKTKVRAMIKEKTRITLVFVMELTSLNKREVNQSIADVPYTWSDDEIDQYLQNSTISFTGDYIEIDGKHYQDVWLSNEAAEKFRVNAFDIKSAFNIASNSNGTYVSGVGSIWGLPVFRVGDSYTTQHISYPQSNGNYGLGSGTVNCSVYNPSAYNEYYRYRVYNPSGTQLGNPIEIYKSNPRDLELWIGKPSLTSTQFNVFQNTPGTVWPTTTSSVGAASGFDEQPFDFDWVSGTIPADEQLAPTDGLHLYVPTDPTEWTDSPETQTIINNYNTYIENNPDIEPDVDLDLNTPGLLDKIGDLLDILGPIIDLMKPSFGPKQDTPTPPEPGDTIADTPWNSLVEWLQRIVNKLDDILGIRDIVSNFKTAFDTSISSILNWLSQIKSILQSILDALSDLVDTIVHGNVDWFSDIVDAIKQPFLPWLNIFKSGVSIWHYVVEWLQSIHEPFVFFFGVLNSLGYTFVLPFYAVAAACIVIAIYRRFGR